MTNLGFGSNFFLPEYTHKYINTHTPAHTLTLLCVCFETTTATTISSGGLWRQWAAHGGGGDDSNQEGRKRSGTNHKDEPPSAASHLPLNLRSL